MEARQVVYVRRVRFSTAEGNWDMAAVSLKQERALGVTGIEVLVKEEICTGAERELLCNEYHFVGEAKKEPRGERRVKNAEIYNTPR